MKVHSRRDEIIAGLEEIFLKEGFRQVRIEELASRLRCSRQTLYRLAPSKGELFLLVLDRFLARIREEGMEAASSDAEPGERIEAFLRPGIANTLNASRRFTEDVEGFEPGRRLLADHQRERIAQLRQVRCKDLLLLLIADLHSFLLSSRERWELRYFCSTPCTPRSRSIRVANVGRVVGFCRTVR